MSTRIQQCIARVSKAIPPPAMFIILVLLGVIAYGTALPTASTSGLVKMGSYAPKSSSPIGIASFNPFDYYVSTTAAQWSIAREDCQRQLDGDLLWIESPEEYDFVATQLERYGSAVTYWTSGQLVTQSFGYWGATGQILPIWLNWTPGHPPRRTNTLMRVRINHHSRFFSTMEVEYDTVPQRYICKAPSIP